MSDDKGKKTGTEEVVESGVQRLEASGARQSVAAQIQRQEESNGDTGQGNGGSGGNYISELAAQGPTIAHSVDVVEAVDFYLAMFYKYAAAGKLTEPDRDDVVLRENKVLCWLMPDRPGRGTRVRFTFFTEDGISVEIDVTMEEAGRADLDEKEQQVREKIDEERKERAKAVHTIKG